ncbi:MAG: polysaccharide deacetylase family protein [bacterium]
MRLVHGSLILGYHRVLPALDRGPLGAVSGPGLTAEVKRFRRQLEVLARLFAIVPLHELLAQLLDGDVRPGQAAITFDDGYADNYLHAFPVLSRMGIPATIFLITDHIEHGVPFLWDGAARLLQATMEHALPLPVELNGDLALGIPVNAPQSLQRLKKLLGGMDRHKRCELLGKIAPIVPEDERPLSWDQVRAMLGRGVSFGAHSCSHPSLVEVSDSRLRDEVESSRDLIAARLGVAPVSFAYPFGRFDARVCAAVESAGFLGAVTINRSLCTSASRRYVLPRLTVMNWETHTFLYNIARLAAISALPAPVKAWARGMRAR